VGGPLTLLRQISHTIQLTHHTQGPPPCRWLGLKLR
jgi:hypothetical protein